MKVNFLEFPDYGLLLGSADPNFYLVIYFFLENAIFLFATFLLMLIFFYVFMKNIKIDVACQYTSTCIIIRVKKHVKIGLNWYFFLSKASNFWIHQKQIITRKLIFLPHLWKIEFFFQLTVVCWVFVSGKTCVAGRQIKFYVLRPPSPLQPPPCGYTMLYSCLLSTFFLPSFSPYTDDVDG
jgi:hypothetical protein